MGLPMLAPVRLLPPTSSTNQSSPSSLPQLDKRAVFASQKYNPTRTFTPSGTLGYAGVQAAIYPVCVPPFPPPLRLPLTSSSPSRSDSPGGYQILGRTLTPWSAYGRYGKGYEGHFLIRNFDIVKWQPVSEEDFAQVRLSPSAFPAPLPFLASHTVVLLYRLDRTPRHCILRLPQN